MNKKNWLKVIFVLLTAMLAIFLFSVFGIRKRIDITQTSGDDLYRLSSDKTVGQTFLANKDNLNIIILDLKNAALRNQQPIYFHLEEAKTALSLREIEISGLNVGDPSSVRFQFDPILDSAGKKYYFYLNSPTSTKEDTIEVYHSSQDLYSGGEMMVNDQKFEGELRFTSYYYPGSKTTTAREMVKDFRARLLVDKSFLIAYLVLLFLTFGLSLAI